jgi:hypothetical protein
MTMTRVDPVAVHVRTGWFDGAPREITWGDETLPVMALAASATRHPHTGSRPARGSSSRSRSRGRLA